jgi:hypothetical protein
MWLKPRMKPRWLVAGWAIAALIATVVQKSLSIIISPAADIGNGAPVVFDHIFVPDITSDPTNDSLVFAAFDLEAPAFFRALGTAQVINDMISSRMVHQSTIVGNSPDKTPSIKIDYGYNITALEFGLQHYLDLTLNVKGSCYTEYGWYVQPKNGANETSDVYHLWNDSSKSLPVSATDAPEPRVYIEYESEESSEDGNNTYALIPSTVGRKSHTIGTDPWYLTGQVAGSDNNFTVLPGRPVLSCWQSDLWSYRGQSASTVNVATLPGLQGLGESHLDRLFTVFLSKPTVPSTAVYLGASALRSASSALARTFPANESSIFADMQRLVLVSFIKTQNSLLDTTLYPNTKNGVSNGVTSDDRGIADFIVYGKDITTLSMRVLIIVPSVMVALWLLVLFLRSKTQGSTDAFEYLEAKKIVEEHEQRNGRKVDEESPDMKGDTKLPTSETRDVATADKIHEN